MVNIDSIFKDIENTLRHKTKMPKSQWFVELHGIIRCYLRINPYDSSLTIANVNVQQKFRNQGIYSYFLEHIEKIATKYNFAHVVIENVLDYNQYYIYDNRNFQWSEIEGVRSYFKIL